MYFKYHSEGNYFMILIKFINKGKGNCTHLTLKSEWQRKELWHTYTGEHLLMIFYNIFQMEEDMENFLRFKLVGGYLKSRIDVVPHRFNCQPDRNVTSKIIPRRAASKRTAQRLVSEALAGQRVAPEATIGNL